ncbi:hypothetical protein [Macrococcoides canis]|uniref:hypothetical protein n=1 Tax=Macrococcoides canis TaxID=1855823 RepID=UPI0022B8B7D6|nr:hypothetical protein [Macrococcus canis]WBF54044.1 hypothetical protein LL975_12130 [Macrococcus canis]
MDIRKAISIDENTTFYFHPSLEHRMNQLSLSGDTDIDKLITLCPRLYINHSTYDLKVKTISSDFEIKVTSMKTQKEYLTGVKFKISTPYPNKDYLCAGTLVNRKGREGISFIPDDEDFSPYEDNNVKGDNNKFFTTEREKTSLYDNIFISKEDNERNFKVEEYNKYLNNKYEIASYKVKERWQVKGQYGDVKLESNVLEINYYLYVLRYKKQYIRNIIPDKPVIEIATAGTKDRSNIRHTALGHVYQDELTTPVNLVIHEESMTLIPTNFNALTYEIDALCEVHKSELSHKLVSMVPIFE